MNDQQLQKALLKKYYERRTDGFIKLNTKDFDNFISDEEIRRISKILREKNLIDTKVKKLENGKVVFAGAVISSEGMKVIRFLA